MPKGQDRRQGARSAHPAENRRFMEMYEPNSPLHEEYHDNMFCHDHAVTVEFMQDVKVPWIAFTVLAAGAMRQRNRPQMTPRSAPVLQQPAKTVDDLGPTSYAAIN